MMLANANLSSIWKAIVAVSYRKWANFRKRLFGK